MAVRLRGGRYTVEFEQQGVRVFRRCPPATSRAQAVALEAKLRSEIFDRRALDRKPDLSLEACVDLWLRDRLAGKKDQRMPRQNAEHLRPFLRGKSVRDVQDVARAISSTTRVDKSTTPLSAATLNRRLAVLKAALRHAWQQGWIGENLSGKIRKLTEPPGREVYLTPTQVRALAAGMATTEGRAAILLLAYTGLRVGELLAITKADVTRATRTGSQTGALSVRESKSGRPRVVPVPTQALGLLSRLPLSLSYTQLHWQFRAARKAVGMEHVRIHDLRHSYASMLINAGVDLYTVGKLLGHSTPTTTARYSHLSQESLRAAVQRIK